MSEHNTVPEAGQAPAAGIFYPTLLRRVQAVLIDSVFLITLFFVTINLVAPMEIHGGAKFAVVIVLMLAIEPLLVTFTGATIGQHLLGLRVQCARRHVNLGLLRAGLRGLLKMFVGWLSLAWILITERHQALHDMAARSVVVIKDPNRVPTNARLQARQAQDAGFLYPSKGRRVVFILLYGIGTYALITISMVLLILAACRDVERCHANEYWISTFGGYALIGLIATVLVLGWRGHLPGCRRKRIAD